MNKMNCWALIVAGGRGTRAGLGVNKVYMPLDGETVLEKCLRAFDASGLFQGAVVVISPDDEARYAAITSPPIVKAVTFGGATRQGSVYNGLLAVPGDADIVAVHDAARPFVTAEIMAATIESAAQYGSGVISTPVTDTIKQVGDGGLVTTLDRNSLFSVQTPQTFAYGPLMDAHRRAREEGYDATDDAALFERYMGGVRLVTVPGAEHNIKLTYKKDFERRDMDIRMGHGYDAHRLTEGRKLVLCGVEIPYERGLDGHSDADVAVHALMDALLGAAALGDIGRHFPDSDEAYRGISSMKLLDATVEKLRVAGYAASNVDVTIIAQRPKLAPCMDEMRRRVAEGLGLGIDRVNIKATTTERMGFEGAGEGISAHAVAVIKEIRA